MCDSTSSALVTTIPQVYGTFLTDSAWTLNMRFRSFIWPDNLPHNLICKCSREITITHLLNCKHFITFRSKVHDVHVAIHPLMCELKQEFPDVHITAYMDDISIIGPIDSLRTIAEIVQQRYYQIGLSLNISKCLLIGREPADLIIDDQSVPFINYFESGFGFLGCYLGNFDEIRNQLSSLLDNFEEELMVLSDLNIEKHLKFFFLRICYSKIVKDF
ncbi:hypothetical protein P9112_001464 [Eukaryota sp. TZLM1-RC]